MPRAYSADLRGRVVAAVLDGGQSRQAVARRFLVGRSTVYRWVDTAESEGRVAAKPMHGGPPPTIRDDSEAALRRLVAGDNHLTLAEYRDRLAEETGIRVHPWTLGRALRRLLAVSTNHGLFVLLCARSGVEDPCFRATQRPAPCGAGGRTRHAHTWCA